MKITHFSYYIINIIIIIIKMFFFLFSLNFYLIFHFFSCVLFFCNVLSLILIIHLIINEINAIEYIIITLVIYNIQFISSIQLSIIYY